MADLRNLASLPNPTATTFWQVANRDVLFGKADLDYSRSRFVEPNENYLVLASGAHADEFAIDLSKTAGAHVVQWFDPLSGSPLIAGSGADGSKSDKVRLTGSLIDLPRGRLAAIPHHGVLQ